MDRLYGLFLWEREVRKEVSMPSSSSRLCLSAIRFLFSCALSRPSLIHWCLVRLFGLLFGVGVMEELHPLSFGHCVGLKFFKEAAWDPVGLR